MSENLTSKHMAAVEALATGAGMQKAADAAGINVRTLNRWLKRPEVYQALRDQTAGTIDRAARIATDGLPYAVGIARRIMQDETVPDSIRLRAAAQVQDIALKLIEVRDIQEQLDELRAAVGLSE